MKRNSGQSLIGTLVVIAILVGLGLFFVYGGYGLTGSSEKRPDGKGETLIGRSALRAKDSKCMQYLGQIRSAVQIATDPVEDVRPQTLEETRLGSDFYKCPIGKEPYSYDPATGTVKCVHPGHEKY